MRLRDLDSTKARYVMGYRDDRWTMTVTEWILRDVKRTRAAASAMVRLLHENSERLEYFAQCASSECGSLDYSDSRQGRMERNWRPLEKIHDKRDDR
ncbi:hypothetical protein V3C99_009491 [Haemonchus contortus]|uniref:Integrase n=1 Tax=Haemonchus contortus TaxID=6289 RepID=A0A7I4YKN4_HAECO